MIAVEMITALVAGAFGGIVASGFMEAYFGRKAMEEVGEFDAAE